jgi:hypothetical protein
MFKHSPDPFESFAGLVFVLVILVFISMPISGYFKIVSLQKILNRECNGDYSLVDVALNGDSLLQTCRIKNQTITIKK